MPPFLKERVLMSTPIFIFYYIISRFFTITRTGINIWASTKRRETTSGIEKLHRRKLDSKTMGQIRLAGNQIFTLYCMMAHNLPRELQMLSSNPTPRAFPKCPASLVFGKLYTLRHRIIQRAGRLKEPRSELTSTMSANHAVQQDLLHFLDSIRKGA